MFFGTQVGGGTIKYLCIVPVTFVQFWGRKHYGKNKAQHKEKNGILNYIKKQTLRKLGTGTPLIMCADRKV